MNDHRVEFYLDAAHYLALKARADHQDRTISQHLRHLVRLDLEASMAEMLADGRRDAGGREAET